jgi:hypothetical protein
MATGMTDVLRTFDFSDLQSGFTEGGFYEYVFPFLLLYALFSAVLPNLKLFKDRQGRSRKSVTTVVSIIVSLVGVTFETSSGWNVGKLMQVMFPNVSALTILILGLYVVGSILNKNFFTSLFRKDFSAYIFMAIGVIGLGAIVFYLGIAFGFWDLNPLDPQSYWNVVLAVGFLIMGFVFILIGLYGWGAILLSVVGIFLYSSGDESILQYFIDPFIFIFILVVLLLSWMHESPEEERRKLDEKIRDQELALSEYSSNEQSRIRDIIEQGLKGNREKKARGK